MNITNSEQRSFLLFSGILSLVVGAALLFAPLKSFAVFLSVLGIQLIFQGIARNIILLSIADKPAKWGLQLCLGILEALLGALFLAFHFDTPLVSTLFALRYLQLFTGLSLIWGGFVYLGSRDSRQSRIPAVLNIIAGILFVVSFVYIGGALLLLLFAGASLLVRGISLIVLYRKSGKPSG